jgi:serpin B
LIVPGLGDSIVSRQVQRIVLAALFVFAVSPLFGSQASQSPQAPGTGTITGTVRDVDGWPKQFAQVAVLGTKLTDVTDPFGEYRIEDVAPGEHRLRVSFLGYAPAETTVVVKSGVEISVDFTIRTTVVALKGLNLSVRDGVAGLSMFHDWVPLRSAHRFPSDEQIVGWNSFAARLHRELAPSGGNLVHSPFCVTATSALLLRAARGETAREIEQALQTKQDGEELLTGLGWIGSFLSQSTMVLGDTWTMANGAWFDRAVTPRSDYVESIGSDPADTVGVLDFQGAPEEARTAINDWVRKQTGDRIPDILAPEAVNRGTAIVLASALYLHARWLDPFGKSETRDEPFWVSGYDPINVPTMRSASKIPYGNVADAQVVRLDYRGSDIGMVIVLPGSRDGLAGIERRLDGPLIHELREVLKTREVDLRLPRWRMESRWDLIPVLRALGVSKVFEEGRCDLSRAIESKDLAKRVYVSSAVHAATIEVDEEGAEASAATAIATTLSAMDWEEPVAVHVDHPFLWWIQENTTGTILFMGRVVDPRSQGTGVTRQE